MSFYLDNIQQGVAMIKCSILYPNGGCQFYFDSIEAFTEVWGPAAAELQADIPRYTDVAPVIQFNEVKLSV
jgi:uncharacterized protein (TIGR02118 family)